MPIYYVLKRKVTVKETHIQASLTNTKYTEKSTLGKRKQNKGNELYEQDISTSCLLGGAPLRLAHDFNGIF